MPMLLRSVVLGYHFDPDESSSPPTNPYPGLSPEQKAEADAQILQALNRLFPVYLRRRWVFGAIEGAYADLQVVKRHANAMLREVPRTPALLVGDDVDPLCRYVVIQGLHRMSYSFAVNERVGTSPYQPLWLPGNYTGGGTVRARVYITESWEHEIPTSMYDHDQLLHKLHERLDALEGRPALGSAKSFHSGDQDGAPPLIP